MVLPLKSGFEINSDSVVIVQVKKNLSYSSSAILCDLQECLFMLKIENSETETVLQCVILLLASRNFSSHMNYFIDFFFILLNLNKIF